MPSIKKTKYGYSMRVFVGNNDDGRPKQVTIRGSSKKELLLEEKRLREASNALLNPSTISEIINVYIKDNEPTLSPSTIRGYMTVYRQVSATPFGERKVCDLRKRDYQQFVKWLSVRYTPSTVRNIWSVIRSSLVYQDIDPPTIRTPNKPNSEQVIPTPEDMTRFLQIIKDTELEIPVLLCIYIPARRSEVCGLRYPDDFKGNLCHIWRVVVQDKDGKWVTKENTKTSRSNRIVGLPTFLTQKIESRGYITHYNPHTLYLEYRKTLIKNGFPPYKLHALRHFGASMMQSTGVAPIFVQNRGGWSNPVVLNSVYTHIIPEEQRRADDLIFKMLDEQLLSHSESEVATTSNPFSC